jgi:hypothetical protein
MAALSYEDLDELLLEGIRKSAEPIVAGMDPHSGRSTNVGANANGERAPGVYRAPPDNAFRQALAEVRGGPGIRDTAIEVGGSAERLQDMGSQMWRIASLAIVPRLAVDEALRREVVAHLDTEMPSAIERWLRSEGEQLRTRLLVSHSEVFSKVDRLRAEGEFRSAVALPLLGLAAVLVWRTAWWWAIPIVFVATVLGWQSRQRLQQSDDALAEALRVGAVTSPTLESLATLIAPSTGSPPSNSEEVPESEPGRPSASIPET